MNRFVNMQKEKYLNMWQSLDLNMDHLVEYERNTKKQREKQIDNALGDFISYISKMEFDKNKKDEYKLELKAFIRKEMKDTLYLENKELEELLFNRLLDIAHDFIIDAEKFSTDMELVDIMQAMRNVWIMNTLQLVADINIEYTPSIFAYSMIYPYTDNFLDDKNVLDKEKREFNERLSKRLNGENIRAKNKLEESVFALIEIIESQYDRQTFKNVYDSIISIHNGQCRSLYQQNTSLNYKELLDISIEKGGTSVLADGFLVCGNMSDEMASFTMGFGFALQLIDDLQDIYSDRQSGNRTIFSQYSSVKELEDSVKKLFRLLYYVFDLEFSTSPYADDMKKLMIDNCVLMIMEAISEHEKLFSKKFLREIEKFSPVRLKFFKKARKKLKSKTKDIDFNNFR